MKSFSTHIKEAVNAPPDQVYHCILHADPTRIYTGFGPVPAFIRCEKQDADWPVIGAVRTLITEQQHSSLETIVNLTEFSRIQMMSNQFTNRQFDFIDRMESDITLLERSPGITQVDWRYTFVSVRSHLKARLIATVAFPPALKRAMTNLKYFAEKGQYT